MSESATATVGNTVRLQRVFRAPAERVFKAFVDPDALVRWVPPYGFVGKMHEFECKVGGKYRMSFVNFGKGATHSFTVEFLEIVPNERLRYNDEFDDPNLPGVLEVEVEFSPVMCGTELKIVQSGIPEMIPVEMCYLGWQESLQQLANLVEPEIPDGSESAES
ncbi:SRPBCC family protein [Rhodopirellula sp. MGV]|uniref:SRPBCC family protein n=1 Tax=Rhodopirellula sp. MGV TaxID=2023130 RepID=UPI000B97A9F4|nr:SRPBCC family protein [Rhodopirellula sp. MGV]OYP37623.1 hypothetical protein CGZ80_04735 [Rhodopirellula sp. MGV]PNY34941.1 hypothetical protein C2E31_20780 [Rhodopirellula baltica]